MNYIRRAAGTVGTAASYLPVVGSYFGEAPAPAAANNVTRRNNRAANAVAAPAPAPVAAFTAPAATLASEAPAPAPVAAVTGGGSAAEGTLARIRREREEREAAARAAANANKAAKRGAFFAKNTRKANYADPHSAQHVKYLGLKASAPYIPGYQGAAAAYTPPANAAERAAVFRNERKGKNTAVVTGVGKGTRHRRATRRHRRVARRS